MSVTPASSGPSVSPAAQGIVSVNSRGGRSTNHGRRAVAIVVLVALAIVAAMGGWTKFREWRRAEDERAKELAKQENKPALVGRRRLFSSDPEAPPPKVPALVKPTAPEAPCVDSEVLIGPDGLPVMSVSGAPMRICKDGRVFVKGGAQPIPLAKPPASTGVKPPSRYGGDVIVPPKDQLQVNTAAVTPGSPNASEVAWRRALGLAVAPRAGMQPVAFSGVVPPATAPTQLTQAGGLKWVGSGAETRMALGASAIPAASGSQRMPQVDELPNQQGRISDLLRPEKTDKVRATMLGDRNFILPKGRSIDCSLSTRVVSEVSGLAECVLSSNVYSDNGKVLLLERGSEATGEYVATMAQGQRRLFLLWTRVKTPHGVVINLNSPASDALGTAGLPGYVDQRWVDRIGAAVLLSLVQDAIGFATAREVAGGGGDGGGAAAGLFAFQNTRNTGDRMINQILQQTLMIKPTLYKNQGDRVAIYVARDLDFEPVYALRTR